MALRIGISPAGDIGVAESIHHYSGGAFFTMETAEYLRVSASTCRTDFSDDEVMAWPRIVVVIKGDIGVAAGIHFYVVDRFLTVRATKIRRVGQMLSLDRADR